MIKKNNKTVGFIYKNNQNIDKIYKNNQLIFEQGFVREDSGNVPLSTTYQAIGKNLKDYKIYGNSVQGKLPSEYQQVEYIESTGTQYIDTGIITNLNEVYWYVKFELTEIKLGNATSGYNMILGRDSNPQIAAYNNGWTVGNVGSNLPYLPQINVKYEATLNKNGNGGLNIDGQATSISCFANSVTPKIFDIGSNSSKAKIYNVKYIRLSDNVVLNNFIPCYRKSDNVIGMYDLVTNTFFTNAGTGVFLKGSNTPTPDVPIEIESVGEKTKNLFNINNHNNGAPNRDYYVPNLKDGISYTFSCYVQSTDIIIVRGMSSPDDTRGTEIVPFRKNDGYQTETFVASSNYYRYIVRVYNISTNTAYNIQLEEGNTATAYEPYGYKIPVIVGNTTTNIYLDEPLRKVGDYSDYIDFKNQKVFRNVIVNDDTGTDTIENSYTGTTDSSGTSITLPNIPTIKGTTIFEIDTEIQPSSMYIKYKSK